MSEIINSPAHGGNLHYAERRFGKPSMPWQDLSTGISPWPYPVPPVPDGIWQTLPNDHSPLLQAAANYYAVHQDKLLALPGSQYAILRFARGITPGRVAIPNPGYREHAQGWRRAGHDILEYTTADQLCALVNNGSVDHAVVINPNNPTTEQLSVDTLVELHNQLKGHLLVDEAFADYRPEQSVSTRIAACPSLFILRSPGKFFGLAGLRLGFLIGQGAPREQLAKDLDCWAINHPAIWLGTRVLNDRSWQVTQRQRIAAHQQTLRATLKKYVANHFKIVDAGLFTTLIGEQQLLHQLYTHLAHTGIFTRWGYENNTGDNPNAWLRIGLPPDNSSRLKQALERFATVRTGEQR